MSYVGKAAGIVWYEGTGSQRYGTLYAFSDELTIAWSKHDREKYKKTPPTVPGRLTDFATECQFVPEYISSYTILFPPPEIASAVLRTSTLTALLFGRAHVDLVAKTAPPGPRKMTFHAEIGATGKLADLLAATLGDRFEQRQ